MQPADDERCGRRVANLQPLWDAMEKEQKAWYWYDWANSAYVTTIATVLFAPYLISVAEQDACGFVTDDDLHVHRPTCTSSASRSPRARWCSTSSRWPRSSPRSLLPIVGAAADRSAQEEGRSWPASPGPAALAAGCCSSSPGTNWQLGVALLFVANICLGASPGGLRRDPVRDRRPRRARPGLVARLGAGLPRRRPAAGGQPRRWSPCTTRSA